MTVTPKLKRNSIALSYKINGKNYDVYTGITVEPDRWSSSKKEIKGEGMLIAEQNKKIKELQSEIQLYVFTVKSAGGQYFHDELKRHLKSKLRHSNSPKSFNGFIPYYELYIERKKSKYSEQTIKAYKTTLNHLTTFLKSKGVKELDFNSVNYSFLEGFNDFLKDKIGVGPATRGKQVKNIKAVMSDAHRFGKHTSTSHTEYKKDNESSVDVFLTIEEITSLYNYKDFSETEQRAIDVFVFLCLTGIRYSDFLSLQKHEVFEKTVQKKKIWYIKFVQEKTNDAVEVPIMYIEAIELLKKYDFELPKLANAYFNRFLKETLKRHHLFSDKITVKKEKLRGVIIRREKFSAHTGRRSFCTNQYLLGTPIQYVMAASGHKTEAAFRLYVKADQLTKAKGLEDYINY